MTIKRWSLLAGTLLGLGLVGCGSPPEVGDKKEDWNKTAPPPGWKGPGQPDATGGPASGPGGHIEGPPPGQ